jgi:hypothetical protein
MFEQRGTVTILLDFNRYACSFGEAVEWNNYGWLNYLVLITTTIHLILVVKYIKDIGKRYKVLKERYKGQYESLSKQEVKNNQSKL